MEPNREEYVRQVLGAYRQTPGTTGSVRREDRLLATQLHQRQVPLRVVENALVLAAARRLLRPAHALPLGTIRSLAYFQPIIDELLESPAPEGYLQYLRLKLRSLTDRAMPNAVQKTTFSGDR